jgi:hypothetical protein
VSQKEALQSAADEARKAARAAREFAGILDEYAKFIVQPNSRQRADDVHLSAMNKLRVINEGLAVCEKWGEEARKAQAAQATAPPASPPLNPVASSENHGNREPVAKFQPRSVRVHKRNSNR